MCRNLCSCHFGRYTSEFSANQHDFCRKLVFGFRKCFYHLLNFVVLILPGQLSFWFHSFCATHRRASDILQLTHQCNQPNNKYHFIESVLKKNISFQHTLQNYSRNFRFVSICKSLNISSNKHVRLLDIT